MTRAEVGDAVDAERGGRDAGGAQPPRGVAVVVARVQHDEVGTRGEHRLDVRPEPGAEIGNARAASGQTSYVVRPTRRSPAPMREQQLGGRRVERDDALRRVARATSVSPKSSADDRAGDAARRASHAASEQRRARATTRTRHDDAAKRTNGHLRPKESARNGRGRSCDCTAPRVATVLPRGPVIVARTGSSPGSGPRRPPSRPQSVA